MKLNMKSLPVFKGGDDSSISAPWNVMLVQANESCLFGRFATSKRNSLEDSSGWAGLERENQIVSFRNLSRQLDNPGVTSENKGRTKLAEEDGRGCCEFTSADSDSDYRSTD